ncbi:hypothetical protein RND81_04G202500 [Saponaria officinalis]|uniref:Uncharacterized protein n=1 Tax=Saponaria officinalis TaxID=3572 RepID=A0AAW1LNZ3_SAPOF
MAKKKQTHQQKSAEMAESEEIYQNAPETAAADAAGSTVDDTEEKLANLKSLNTMLLSETAKKRQEISELLEDKKSVAAELTRSESERESVAAELTRVREELAKVEAEKEELRREMGEVVKERDEIMRVKCEGDLEIVKLNELSDELRSEIERGRERFDVEKGEFELEVRVKNEEVMELRKCLNDMEEKERSLMGEFDKLKERYEIVSKALRESEEKVEEMRVECEGFKKEVEGLNGEKEVSELNGVVARLREDEEKWRVKFLELEKRNAEVLEEFDGLKSEFGVLLEEKKAKEKEIDRLIGENSENLSRVGELGLEIDGLKSEFGALLEEKKAKEKEIEGLVGEKSENLSKLEALEIEIEGVKRVNEGFLAEKSRLEEVKSRQGDEIRELQVELDVIRSNLLSVQESNQAQLDKNVKLLSEVDEYKSALDRAVNERDDVKRCLDEVRMNGDELRVKVSELLTKIEEDGKVIKELNDARENVVAEKNELEIKYNKLAEEKVSIEKNHVEVRDKVVDLESKLRLKSDMFVSALNMLRNAAMKGDDEGITVNGELRTYMSEIEAIRAVFRSKDEKVGEMEKHIERLHSSVLDAKKKKSFWTMVSSATTILAAVVSLAYATRVR